MGNKKDPFSKFTHKEINILRKKIVELVYADPHVYQPDYLQPHLKNSKRFRAHLKGTKWTSELIKVPFTYLPTRISKYNPIALVEWHDAIIRWRLEVGK